MAPSITNCDLDSLLHLLSIDITYARQQEEELWGEPKALYSAGDTSVIGTQLE